MKVTVEWMKKNYEELNKLYFGNKLPLNIKFSVSRGSRTYGYASYRYNFSLNTVTPTGIKMTGYWDYSEAEQINVLLHEMIHVLDYIENPHHFVYRHRPVSGHSYNSHGWWFLSQCERLNKLGFNVTPHVTKEVSMKSIMTEKVKENLEKRKDNSLICAITCGFCVWYTKTSKDNIRVLSNTIRRRYNWDKFGKIENIKFYEFENDKIAAMRSRSKAFTGWKVTKEKFDTLKKDYKMIEFC